MLHNLTPIQKKFNIQEVADILGIYKGTIKNYETRKIFPQSKRNPINEYREYTEEDIEQLKKILLKGK